MRLARLKGPVTWLVNHQFAQTYPGLPWVQPPSPECLANATLLREKILHFRVAYPDEELYFFTQAPPRCITGQPFVGAGYEGEDFAPALPQNA